MSRQEDFGRYLCGERELRQVTLHELSQATKIPIISLRAIESGAWDDLPGMVFLQGFIRSYGRYLGVEDEVISRFREARIEILREESEKNIEPVGDSAAQEGARRRFGVALFVFIMLIIVTITFSMIWGVGTDKSSQASMEINQNHETPLPLTATT